GGLRNWSWEGKKDAVPRFGFSYYVDGGYKNYLFNNIAVGKSNDITTKLANEAAFQEIIGFQNSFFNNTAYKFVSGSRRQAPGIGRNRYLGNIFDDIEHWVFYHAKVPKGGFDANAHHFDQAKAFFHETNAYSGNVMHDVEGYIGVFESHGKPYDTLGDMQAAMTAHGSQQPGIGVMASDSPLRDPEQGDFRPKPGSAAAGQGVRHFVPWQLSRTVGEWHFTRNNKDVNVIFDESWYMQPYFYTRTMYKDTPRYPLQAEDLTADDFSPGPLESWTDGVLDLDDSAVLHVAHADLVAPFEVTVEHKKKTRTRSWAGADKVTLDVHTGNLLVEAYVKTDDPDGLIAGKGSRTGYHLSVQAGKAVFALRDAGADVLAVTGGSIADGSWHHILAEFDREDERLTLYIDGKAVATEQGAAPASLANSDDFIVGQDLAASLEFLRVCQGTLADAGTDIGELYAWQSDGPQYHDFAGKERPASPTAGALE
ncbi:MAG: LamG-like jellyroll fold domain-containing protein, partial [Planctomycetota bacterium]